MPLGGLPYKGVYLSFIRAVPRCTMKARFFSFFSRKGKVLIIPNGDIRLCQSRDGNEFWQGSVYVKIKAVWQ